MDTLMNSIDTIKEKITDAEYKELCDKMMELNNNKKDFYEIMYIEPYITERVVDEEREYQQRVKISKRTIQMYMSETELKHANNEIKRYGIFEPYHTIEEYDKFKDIILEKKSQIQYIITNDDTNDEDKKDVEKVVLQGNCLSIIRIKKL
jgi:hypothetical protein